MEDFVEENREVKYFEVIGEVITRLVLSIRKALTRLTLARLSMLAKNRTT